MKHKLTFFAFVFTSFLTGFSQDDAYKALLKHTSVVIHKAQKQMIATGKNDAGGLLAKAVLLQANGIKLYEQKKETEAACNSAKARELAALILKNLGVKTNDYYLISADENKLLQNCSDEKQLLAQAKKNLPALSEKDSDYADHKSLNNTNIDLK